MKLYELLVFGPEWKWNKIWVVQQQQQQNNNNYFKNNTVRW